MRVFVIDAAGVRRVGKKSSDRSNMRVVTSDGTSVMQNLTSDRSNQGADVSTAHDGRHRYATCHCPRSRVKRMRKLSARMWRRSFRRRSKTHVAGSVPFDDQLKADFSQYAQKSINAIGSMEINGCTCANDLSEKQKNTIAAILDEFKDRFVSDASEFRPSDLPEVYLDTGDAKPVVMDFGKLMM